MPKEEYDIVIVGAGVTGLATGMYSARLGLKTLILGHSSDKELPIGGVITLTNVVENYPGFKKLTGSELAEKLEEHAREYDKVTIKEEKAVGIKKESNNFVVKTEKMEYHCGAIILATGTKWRKLKMKGAEEYLNKGVHYCALCDGPVYSKRIVGVVGGSDSAAKEAIFLAEYAKKVYIIYRGEKIRSEPINAKLVAQNKKIEIINNTNIVEIKGDKFVNRVILDKPYKGKKEMKIDGIFGAIGHIPLSDLGKSIGVKIDKKGYIKINRDSETNVPGVFAAGDVVDSKFKQAIVGVGEGVIASYSSFEYLKRKNFKLGKCCYHGKGELK